MSFWHALIGAAVGSGFLLFVYGTYFLVRRKEGLGMSDVIMLLIIGAYLGWLPTILTLVLASFAGALVGISFIMVHKEDMQFALPFGTFLAPAAVISLLGGKNIITAYNSFLKKNEARRAVLGEIDKMRERRKPGASPNGVCKLYLKPQLLRIPGRATLPSLVPLSTPIRGDH